MVQLVEIRSVRDVSPVVDEMADSSQPQGNYVPVPSDPPPASAPPGYGLPSQGPAIPPPMPPAAYQPPPQPPMQQLPPQPPMQPNQPYQQPYPQQYPAAYPPPNPGYPPQNQGYQQPIQAGMPVQSGMPGQIVWSNHAQIVTCPYCNATSVTIVRYEPGAGTWLMCLGICFLGGGLGCCLIPFCVDPLQDCVHTCTGCGRVLGRKNVI